MAFPRIDIIDVYKYYRKKIKYCSTELPISWLYSSCIISYCTYLECHCNYLITNMTSFAYQGDQHWIASPLNSKELWASIHLTHWGRTTHICVVKLTIIGSDNGLSPGRRQAIIWTNAGILLIRPLGTNFSEILIGIQTFSFKKMHLKMSSAKWRPFISLNII